MCSDHVIRRCIPNREFSNILQSCHATAYGGHFGGHRTADKVLQLCYYWPYIFKDSYKFVKYCDMCRRIGNIFQKHEMPLTNILEVELFDYRYHTLWDHFHHLLTIYTSYLVNRW